MFGLLVKISEVSRYNFKTLLFFTCEFRLKMSLVMLQYLWIKLKC